MCYNGYLKQEYLVKQALQCGSDMGIRWIL